MADLETFKIIVGNSTAESVAHRQFLTDILARRFIEVGLPGNALAYVDEFEPGFSSPGTVFSITPSGSLFGQLIAALGPWLTAHQTVVQVQTSSRYRIRIDAANFHEVTRMFSVTRRD